MLKNGDRIYVGMANANDGFKWKLFPKIDPDLDTQRELLFMDLIRTGKIHRYRKQHLLKPLLGKNFIGDRFFTDGDAYILSIQ